MAGSEADNAGAPSYFQIIGVSGRSPVPNKNAVVELRPATENNARRRADGRQRGQSPWSKIEIKQRRQ